jgi:hypothetical protein
VRLGVVTGPPCPDAMQRRQSRTRICGQRRICAQFAACTLNRGADGRNLPDTGICPTKGTTPARGGGGEGRRESAPGGRADTPSAEPSTAYYTHDNIAQRKC